MAERMIRVDQVAGDGRTDTYRNSEGRLVTEPKTVASIVCPEGRSWDATMEILRRRREGGDATSSDSTRGLPADSEKPRGERIELPAKEQ